MQTDYSALVERVVRRLAQLLPGADFLRERLSRIMESEEHHRADVEIDGTRGTAFRTQKRDFLNIARGKFSKDDRYSWLTCFMGMDEGGSATGAPTCGKRT